MSLLVDNRALLQRFRRGEAKALRQVLAHYAPLISGLLRRGFGFNVGGERIRFGGYESTFDLEDALQEVFRRAFSENARLNYDGLRPYKAYLGAIARNTVINEYQARKRKLERFAVELNDTMHVVEEEWSASDDPLAFGDSEPTGKPAKDVETIELRNLLLTFRDTLSDRERDIFGLRFEEHLSHAAITERSGISPSKIKTTEAHIRKRLLHYLREHGYLRAAQKEKSKFKSTSNAPQGENP